MKKLLICAPLAAVLFVSGDLQSQRPDSSGRRGGGGGRGESAPSPSYNRPSSDLGGRGRPSQGPTTRPSLVPQSRPEGGGMRPPPNVGGNRPSLTGRPDVGGGNRRPT